MKKQKGITLMVLIITVIVLLMLATVTINIAAKNNFFDHAQKANNEYIVAKEKEAIREGFSEYQQEIEWGKNSYFSSYYIETDDGEKVSVKNIKDGWKIHFSATQNNYILSSNGTINQEAEFMATEPYWVENGDVVAKIGQTIHIGDYVDYNPMKDTNGATVLSTSYTSNAKQNASATQNSGRTSGYTEDQVFQLEDYKGGWRVLGVNDENQILLISAKGITTSSGGKDGYYCLKGEEGYINGVEELNAIASIYGQGKGAVGAKSISMQDFYDMTGLTLEKFREYVKRDSKSLYITYIASNNTVKALLDNEEVASIPAEVFKYYDATTRSFKALNEGETVTIEETSSFYGVGTLIELLSEFSDQFVGIFKDLENIEEESEKCNLLFGGDLDPQDSWLASRYNETRYGALTSKELVYGIGNMYNMSILETLFALNTSFVTDNTMVTITGTEESGYERIENETAFPVRVIVTLDENAIIGSSGGTESNPRSLTIN